MDDAVGHATGALTVFLRAVRARGRVQGLPLF
jgi:hypothetical protein